MTPALIREPFRGKASGKTRKVASLGGAWHQHDIGVFPDCPFCLKRIAELEAELADAYHRICGHCGKPWVISDHGGRRIVLYTADDLAAEIYKAIMEEKARAEKADAEVERLTALVVERTELLNRATLERHIERVHPGQKYISGCMWCEKLNGGGRESGPAGSPVETRETAQTRAAANPAARNERRRAERAHLRWIRKDAARKERDDG